MSRRSQRLHCRHVAPVPRQRGSGPIRSYFGSGIRLTLGRQPLGRLRRHPDRPIEGVEIYCDSCGSPTGHTFVHTEADGFYRLPWAMNGVHPLFVTRAGYEIVDPTGTLRDSIGRIRATVRGDTRFDIELARR